MLKLVIILKKIFTSNFHCLFLRMSTLPGSTFKMCVDEGKHIFKQIKSKLMIDKDALLLFLY